MFLQTAFTHEIMKRFVNEQDPVTYTFHFVLGFDFFRKFTNTVARNLS